MSGFSPVPETLSVVASGSTVLTGSLASIVTLTIPANSYWRVACQHVRDNSGGATVTMAFAVTGTVSGGLQRGYVAASSKVNPNGGSFTSTTDGTDLVAPSDGWIKGGSSGGTIALQMSSTGTSSAKEGTHILATRMAG